MWYASYHHNNELCCFQPLFHRGSSLWHGLLTQFKATRGLRSAPVSLLPLNYSHSLPVACSLLLCILSLFFSFCLHPNASVHKFCKHSVVITINQLKCQRLQSACFYTFFWFFTAVKRIPYYHSYYMLVEIEKQRCQLIQHHTAREHPDWDWSLAILFPVILLHLQITA